MFPHCYNYNGFMETRLVGTESKMCIVYPKYTRSDRAVMIIALRVQCSCDFIYGQYSIFYWNCAHPVSVF